MILGRRSDRRCVGNIIIINTTSSDIDFYNHVYVNPVDGTISCYWASDIIHKIFITATVSGVVWSISEADRK